MKYFRVSKVDGERKELSYEEAKALLPDGYTERVCTFDELLSNAGVLPFRFFYLEIEE